MATNAPTNAPTTNPINTSNPTSYPSARLGEDLFIFVFQSEQKGFLPSKALILICLVLQDLRPVFFVECCVLFNLMPGNLTVSVAVVDSKSHFPYKLLFYIYTYFLLYRKITATTATTATNVDFMRVFVLPFCCRKMAYGNKIGSN